MTEFLELYMRLLENMTKTSRRTSANVDNFPERMRDLIFETSKGFFTILRIRIIYGVRACKTEWMREYFTSESVP